MHLASFEHNKPNECIDYQETVWNHFLHTKTLKLVLKTRVTNERKKLITLKTDKWCGTDKFL